MTTAHPIQEPSDTPYFASDRDRLEYYWKQFITEFPTEQDCVHELYRRVYKHDIKCLGCNSRRVKKLQNARIIICHNCKKETYTLSGTFFHNIREARRWLAALWFTDQGIKLNASSFARLVQVVRATADAIFKKISFVVIGTMSDLPEISSREFATTFRKRSRMTPAGEHPLAEQSELEKQIAVCNTPEQARKHLDLTTSPESGQIDKKQCEQTRVESELSDREKTIYDALSSEPIHIETLLHRSKMPIELLSGTLVMLELRGLVKRQIGDWYSLLPPPSPPGPVHACPLNEKSKLTIGSFIEFVHSTFSGISRKYLQNYLGWYWCLVDKKRWKPGALLNECSGSPRTSLKEILEYVSPLLVKFSPVPIN